MNTITLERTVGELVTERPGRSRVFEKYGIDYCCGGKRPLAEACKKKGVSLEDLVQELERSDASATESEPSCDSMTLTELVNHIIVTHHAYLAAELPRLRRMAERVAKVHGDRERRLVTLDQAVGELSRELESHMAKEERILFPFIQLLEQSPTLPYLPFGTLANPIRAMESEHDIAGNGLETIRQLTDGYAPPNWACNTYRALFDGLRELELDLHQHIHKENNILFPKSMELEKSRG